MDTPKVLIFDIETSPNVGYTWAKYDQNVIKFVHEKKIISFSYKWLGDKKVRNLALPDFEGYVPGIANIDDFAICHELHQLIDEADVVVAHNGDDFDIKVTNARLLWNGFAPPTPYKTVDTKKVAKKHFKFNSNSLNDLAEYLGIGSKLKHEGFDLWLSCLEEGDGKAWRTMRRYNNMDVELLELVYLEMRPWMTNHPNMAAISGSVDRCTQCLSESIQRRGFNVAQRSRSQRYQCQSCGAWFSGKSEVVHTLSA